MRLIFFSPLFRLILALALIEGLGAPPGPALAETPDRRLTILAGLQESPKGWPGLLAELPAALGPQLAARVRISYQPEADGVLAANRLALANLDGNLLGALPMVAMVTRVLEDRTPYLMTDFQPTLLAPGQTYALLAPRAATFNNFRDLAQVPRLTLLHDGLDPLSPGTLAALGALRDLGLQPALTYRSPLTPLDLETVPNSVMAWPLEATTVADPAAPPYKIIAVLTDRPATPCAPPGLSLDEAKIQIPIQDYLGLYFPKGSIQAETDQMAQALLAALAEPRIQELAQANCLDLRPQYLLGPAAAEKFLASQVANQTQLRQAWLKPAPSPRNPRSDND